MERFEACLAARLESHVDHVQAGVAHLCEQLGVGRVRPAVDLPEHAPDEVLCADLVEERAGPPVPRRPEDRKVVVLKEHHRGVELVEEVAHLARDLGRSPRPDDLAGGGAVEHVDRAERARPCTAARRDHLRDVATEDGPRLDRWVWPR